MMRSGLLLALVLLGACADDHRAASTVDSWHRPPPSGFRFDPWKELDRARVKEVAPAGEAEAERLLDSTACREASSGDAARLATAPPPELPGTGLYLVRGVCLNRATGGLSLSTQGSSLLVEHGSLGRHAVPMQRQALLVRLDAPPREVYVLCSMAE